VALLREPPHWLEPSDSKNTKRYCLGVWPRVMLSC
jgi:hypothetical protein